MGSAGAKGERLALKLLREDGWWAIRTPASQGAADIVALKAYERPRLIQVKRNHGSPYMNFRREDREALVRDAAIAGAVAELWHWPPHGTLRVIPAADWP
jgi:Holliday junction resolvase